jgi:hypothetical protein
MMDIGVEIIFRDETKEWIDPVDQYDFEVMEATATDVYKIVSGHNIYEYNVSEVKELRQYPLFQCCGFDSRSERHSRHCQNKNNEQSRLA